MIAGAAALNALAASSSIQLLDGDPPVVRVRSASLERPETDWAAILQVCVDKADAPALAGSYKWQPGILTFTPRYRFQAGLAYRATFRLGSEATMSVLTPASSANPKTATYVERVYPTATVLPENQLKLYIRFSAPMSRGEAFQRLHLIDRRTNAEVKLPFLEIDEELWDREQERLTILFDPGRVKRGLVPANEVGPPLVAGGQYRLVVDGEWKDAGNRTLRERFTKDFSVGPAWRAGIDVRQWKLTPPKAGTRDALLIDFPRPLDSALLVRCLAVAGVSGEAHVQNEERSWMFVPDLPWKPGLQHLKVLEVLEDLAGNKVGRAFDVDRFERVDRADRSHATGSVQIPFTPVSK